MAAVVLPVTARSNWKISEAGGPAISALRVKEPVFEPLRTKRRLLFKIDTETPAPEVLMLLKKELPGDEFI